jgi:hypothetical protein
VRSSGRRGEVGPARWAVSAYFLAAGMTAGVRMARVPAAKVQAHLSDGTLGIALFSIPVGLVIGAALAEPLAERLVDRVGSTLLLRVSAGRRRCLQRAPRRHRGPLAPPANQPHRPRRQPSSRRPGIE